MSLCGFPDVLAGTANAQRIEGVPGAVARGAFEVNGRPARIVIAIVERPLNFWIHLPNAYSSETPLNGSILRYPHFQVNPCIWVRIGIEVIRDSDSGTEAFPWYQVA